MASQGRHFASVGAAVVVVLADAAAVSGIVAGRDERRYFDETLRN